MSHNKLSYQEFIQSSFSPSVAVMCSPLVDYICKKNNLSFTELVQPFCKLNTEATFRDPSGTTISLKNFRINVSDVNSRPPQPTMARKFLNESVSSHANERTTVVEVGGLSLDVPVSVPWFEAWRDTFLQVQFPSDHEFTKHYLACILVVSSTEASPLDTLTQMEVQLQQMQTVSPAKLPKWFSSAVLRYHVLLHDNTEGPTALADSIYETMKTTYGVNSSFFLNINSQEPSLVDTHLPDPWSQFLSKQIQSQDVNEADLEVMRNHLEGLNTIETAQEVGETTPTPTTPVIMHPLSPMTDLCPNSGFEKTVVDGELTSKGNHGGCLTADDLDKIREFITCFCLNCLIPHVEQQIQQLTELISNKKGMSKSLLSATKRWFGSSKPGIANTPTPNVTYTQDSTELQLRRLGDLCFMFGAYSLAFTAYHAAKRDFNGDGAWLYYAGGLEMAALSLFMQPTDPTRKALEYAEESILTYLNSCRMPQFATRATLWTAECLRGRGQTGEAARQLIRMTSEDSDLRSALLLEQAAYCFLAAPRPPMPRKYAFHLVLAGHRFSKAGQRRHSLRCYRQAFQVYEGKQWSLAEDHIQHTIGRQASGLKLVVEAAEAFALLLPRASRQSSTQQTTFLREYISTQQQLNSETGELPLLPLPVVDNESIQVLLGRPPPPSVDDCSALLASGVSFELQPEEAQRWVRLEEQLVTAVTGSQPMVFRPSVELLNNNTNNTNPSTTYIGETISMSVSLSNPLHIPITLLNLRLLWSFIPSSGGLCQENSVTEDSSVAVTQVTQSLVIPADMSSKVILQVTPQQVGELRITGLAYVLEGSESAGTGVGGRQLLLPRGKRLRTAKSSGAEDGTVLYAADHRLRLNVDQFAPSLRVSFQGLRKDMLCGELTSVTVHCENCGNMEVTRLLVSCATPNVMSLGRPLATSKGEVREVPLPHPLAPGQSLQVPMQVRAHNLKGAFTIDLLFYYENDHNQRKPLYRLVRHSWPIQVHDSLQVCVSPTRSAISQDMEETLNLRVQVQNTSQAHDSVKCDLCLACAALYSPNWQLLQKGTHPSVMSLTSQELAHFLVKVRRKDSVNPEISKLTLAEDSGLSPLPDFLPQFKEEGADPSTAAEVKAQEGTSQLESVLKLQATFILMWKATVETRGGDSRVAVGQHQVSLSWVGETNWWPPPTLTTATPSTPAPTPLRIFGDGEERGDSLAVRQRLVTFSVVSTPMSASPHSHPFTSDRVRTVPVEVVVQNCCDCELEVKVEASGATVSKKDYMYSPQSCHSFQWVGCTRRLLRLTPHHSSCVKMAASVGQAGTYDLSAHLTVCARRPDDTDFVAQTWRSDAILVVT